MAKFENVQGITEIRFEQNVQCYCPLGDDWYTNQLNITMIPNKIIPDYCDVDNFIRGLSGTSLIIEDVIKCLFEYIMREYEPKNVRIESYVNDAKHLPVRVIKEG